MFKLWCERGIRLLSRAVKWNHFWELKGRLGTKNNRLGAQISLVVWKEVSASNCTSLTKGIYYLSEKNENT